MLQNNPNAEKYNENGNRNRKLVIFLFMLMKWKKLNFGTEDGDTPAHLPISMTLFSPGIPLHGRRTFVEVAIFSIQAENILLVMTPQKSHKSANI